MGKSVKIVINPEQEDDIIISCKELTPEVLLLENAAMKGYIGKSAEMIFKLNNEEFILPTSEILFFESYDNKIRAHTKKNMYFSDKTLSQLTEELDGNFFRVSKSCIVNLKLICSLKRELTGICEARFAGSNKTIYISRLYYKPFRERFDEIRLGR